MFRQPQGVEVGKVLVDLGDHQTGRVLAEVVAQEAENLGRRHQDQPVVGVPVRPLFQFAGEGLGNICFSWVCQSTSRSMAWRPWPALSKLRPGLSESAARLGARVGAANSWANTGLRSSARPSVA